MIKQSIIALLIAAAIVLSAFGYLGFLAIQQISCDLQQNEAKSEACHARLFDQHSENLTPDQTRNYFNVQ